ncbi:MAG TPA: tRNA 2-thiouridine(34) synthase MnmA [Candidatus Sulfopaludibacter sp.]|nr:tRNA 2-thiouridine(34) synthase MnmA [Candidatus Sulfopaludibacter sp.]
MNSDKRQRVVCGMSGGVDSSATAALLLEQGYEVIGITLKLWPQDCVNRAEDKCCGPQAVTDARAVCHTLGIPYYLIDEAAEFQKHVIQYFADEYKAGRTPNPCVMCNQNLKFGRLIDRARQLGADCIATGHFARVERVCSSRREEAPSKNSELRTPNSEINQSLVTSAPTRHLLKRGRDLKKDQSYFLFSLRQDQLARAMFPLGEKTKSDTREVARHCQLKTADKEESMEICFVPDNNYGGFLRQAGLAQKHRGEIVDLHGTVLGHHDGIEFYTIGQRRGLGITTPKPVYVVELDAEDNRVVVGDETALDRDEFTAMNCNWIPFDKLTEPVEVIAKIRYNHPGTLATVTPAGNGAVNVKLHSAQRAITPGQAAVFYQDDLVLGGGWITR